MSSREAPKPGTCDPDTVERAVEALRLVVRERGLKASATREAIARAALRRTGHFSAEDLIADLRRDGSEGGQVATVYRVLPLLVEAGLLQVTLLSRRDGTRYERAFEREHHDHLVCTRCGEIVEFEFEAIEVMQRQVASRFGYRLTGHVHELFGLCRLCASRNETPGSP
jgi:Fur family ferric uptake transcriptional regulator